MKNEIKKAYENINLKQNDKDVFFTTICEKAKNRAKGNRQLRRNTAKRKILVAVAGICVCLGTTQLVFAAIKWLTPSQVAEKFEDLKLSKAFGTNEEDYVIQTSKDYRVIYMGAVTGSHISDLSIKKNIDESVTYAIFAVEKMDGTPIVEEDHDAVKAMVQFVPLFQGAEPKNRTDLFGPKNIHFSGVACVLDGVLYQLTAISDLEMYANRKVYFGGYQTKMLSGKFDVRLTDMYRWDEVTGEVSRREDFTEKDYVIGNYLFELKLDPKKADPEKADQYLEEWMEGDSAQEMNVLE